MPVARNVLGMSDGKGDGAGESDADKEFVQLLVTHQVALKALVFSLLPGNPNADDVIQDTNALIWERRREFEMGTNFKAWIFSVAKFKVMSMWRDEKRRKETGLPHETLTKIMEEAADGGLESTDSRHEELRECLKQLRPKDRGLVLRRYIDGYSLKKLATEVGRNADSVKGSLHRIRLVLRSCVRSKLSVRKVMS